MDLRPEFIDLSKPNDLLALKKHLSEMADELDILYSTTSPNGTISARQGRICLYNNSGTYSYWINTTGSTTWVEISNQTLWQVDGTETQLKTADEIDMQSKKIINVTDPASAQDASTKNYTDGKISKTTAGEIAAMTEKTTLVDADLFLIEDSAASNAKKKVQKSNILLPVLSNVIARWGFPDGGSTGTEEGAYGIDQDGTNLAGEFSLRSHSSRNGSYVTLISIPWTKISGVNTLTIHARAKASTGDGVSIKVTIGGLNNSGIVASITYANLTPFTIDISSLTNGTIYTIAIQAKNNDSNGSNISEQNVIQYTIEGS